jgi:hypothetical protein
VSLVIEYLCASQEHQSPEDAPNPLIIHEGACGYCPAGVAADHDWRATGGKTLATVREWLGRPLPADRTAPADFASDLR